MRRLDGPVKEFFRNAGGVSALAWCPFNEDLVLICIGNKKILLLNIMKEKVRNYFIICLRL